MTAAGKAFFVYSSRLFQFYFVLELSETKQ